MQKTLEVYKKAIETALELSDICLNLINGKDIEKALDVLENRSRVVSIILHLDEQLRLSPEANGQKHEEYDRLYRLISKVNLKDEQIFEMLSQEKILTQNEIAKTCKNKENLKGYNLNNLK